MTKKELKEQEKEALKQYEENLDINLEGEAPKGDKESTKENE